MNKIKIKVDLKSYTGNYYIFVVDLDCLTKQKPFTNEIGTFYIKSFLRVKEDLWDYECELMDVEDFREEQLKKLLKNK